MQLRNVIESPCGLRYMIDRLEIQSGYARRFLLDQHMMLSKKEIDDSFDLLRRFVDFIEQVDTPYYNTLRFRLQGLKDIRTTIRNLSQSVVLDDIELFEIKHLSILSADVANLLKQQGFDNIASIPALDEVLGILDPDGLKVATFYIYDSYCQQLKELRSTMRKHPEQQEELMTAANEIEAEVRADLSRKLQPFCKAIEAAQVALAQIDIHLAKALQMKEMGLCFPNISETATHYCGLFHPQVKASLNKIGKVFQAIDIRYGNQPTLITGANMGGKTVVLKTLTLCQYLCQFGFGIPAQSAEIELKNEIYFCIGDEQSIEKGLSSFAAEMKNIDAVIKASRQKESILALIDEPARTTNPTEGTALVSALVSVLSNKTVSLVMTTHYDIEPTKAHRLRVKGFADGVMNYELVEVQDGEAPHEALNIAESLGIDEEWISTARRVLDKS